MPETVDSIIEELGDRFYSLDREEEEGMVWYRAWMSDEEWEHYRSVNPESCVYDCDGYYTGDTALEAMMGLRDGLKESDRRILES